jgi:hypothetical protein
MQTAPGGAQGHFSASLALSAAGRTSPWRTKNPGVQRSLTIEFCRRREMQVPMILRGQIEAACRKDARVAGQARRAR